MNNELLNALALMANKPLNKLPRDLQSVVRKHIPIWSSMTPSERATKIGEVDKQLSVKLRIKLSRAVKASELAQDSPDYERWLEIYRKISAKQREINEWELLPDPTPSQKKKKQAVLSRLGIQLAKLNDQITKPAQPAGTSVPVVTSVEGTARPSKAPAQAATLAPVVAASDNPAPHATIAAVRDEVTKTPEVAPRKRRTWQDEAMHYVRGIYKSGQYATAKALFNTLEHKAGKDSPFDKGTGENRGSLFVREVNESVSLRTFQNHWETIKSKG